MNSENKLIIHSNENDKEINHYGKLLLAYKDYQLMEAIKLLPDDMIKEIKQYVMTPYKFMPELKLYKFPVFKLINNNCIIRLIINNEEDRNRIENNLAVDFDMYQLSMHNRPGNIILNITGLDGGNSKKSKYQKNLETYIEGTSINTVSCNTNIILKQLHKINTKTKKKIHKILKDNNVKGRTKLLKDCSSKNQDGRSEVINALMKI